MSDPIESSGWTGPPESKSAPRTRGAFTHLYGQPQITSDYARLAAAEQDALSLKAKPIPSQLWAVRRLTLILSASPFFLWLAHWLVGSSTGDFVVQDYSYHLFVPAFAAVGLAFLLLSIKSVALIWLRKGVALLAILGMILGAAAYAYVAIKAHRDAVMSEPERVFVTGSKDSVNFEREDGSFLIGTGRRIPRAHGNCVTVSVLKADYGFRWVRVVEWVPRQRGQLFWPLRRAVCFGDRPLASFGS